jgi:anti-sigma factor RsiW
MSTLDCRRVRRLLACYHDGELEMDTQVAVQVHLRGCPACVAERRALREVGVTLRAAMVSRVPEDRGRMERHVMGRLQAERAASWRGRLDSLFEDLHLVWAAAGATAATVMIVCALVASLALAMREQPLSMAALIGALAAPGSDRNPVSVDGRMLLPRSDPQALMGTMPLDTDDDTVFALSAVVTRDGLVRNLELLRHDPRAVPVEDREILELFDAVSQARFEPAMSGGMPVAVNLVWLVAHTTVRGKGGDIVWPVVHEPRSPDLAPAVAPPGPPVSELAQDRPDIAAA